MFVDKWCRSPGSTCDFARDGRLLITGDCCLAIDMPPSFMLSSNILFCVLYHKLDICQTQYDYFIKKAGLGRPAMIIDTKADGVQLCALHKHV